MTLSIAEVFFPVKVQRERNYRKRNLARRRALIVCAAVVIVAAAGAGVFLAVNALTGAESMAPAAASAASAAPSQTASEAVSEAAPETASEAVSETASAADTSAAVSGEPGDSSAADSAEPAEPGDYSDAAFIGDSRTEALKTYGLLNGATYYTYKGLKVDTVFTEPCIDEGGTKMTVMDAISRHQYQRIYISLGVNELGWVSTDIFIEDYGKIIDTLKETQPGATIYVQAILPVSAKKSEQDSIYNNPRINEFNTLIEQMAKDKGATFLAVNTAVMDETGALPDGASTDGVHPNIDYCRKWTAYLNANS